jgi:hypothetical protein
VFGYFSNGRHRCRQSWVIKQSNLFTQIHLTVLDSFHILDTIGEVSLATDHESTLAVVFTVSVAHSADCSGLYLDIKT